MLIVCKILHLHVRPRASALNYSTAKTNFQIIHLRVFALVHEIRRRVGCFTWVIEYQSISLIQISIKKRSYIGREFPPNHLKEFCINVLSISFSSWAVSTVMTRQNSIPRLVSMSSGDENEDGEGSGTQPTPALIPLWDLANHTEGVVTTSFNPDTNRIEGAALMDCDKGDQIFIYYGARNNTNFLVHNGSV